MLLGVPPQTGNAIVVQGAQPARRSKGTGQPGDNGKRNAKDQGREGRILHRSRCRVVEQRRDAVGTSAVGTDVSSTARPIPNPMRSTSIDRLRPIAAQTRAMLRRRATRTPAVRKISATQGSQVPWR